MTVVETDIAIVGAGPIGLFATYYAGFRGLRVALVDSLPELGGQITTMYPEKQIHDVAGFPSVRGRDLVSGLVAQAESAHPVHLLGRTATSLEDAPDGLTLHLSDGTRVETRSLLVTAGIGRFSPRALPVGHEWVGRGIEFFVPDFEPYRDKDVVIVGGGDSAFDWAEQLEPLARSVTLVHRRDTFRAHARTVAKVLASNVQVLTNAELAEVRGTDRVESVAVRVAIEGETRIVPCQAVVAALGFVADLGPLQEWGMETVRRHILVDQSMRTSRERVFAAGDVAEYPGKVRLIAVGFGEAATAVNHAAVVVDPGGNVFPGHSSDDDV